MAARWAKVHRQMHYDWLKEEDGAYRRAFADAEPKARRALEDEAVRRAHQGVRKVVRYKGKIVGHDTEYSDTLMALLLKRDPKFREKVDIEASGKEGAPPITLVITPVRGNGQNLNPRCH